MATNASASSDISTEGIRPGHAGAAKRVIPDGVILEPRVRIGHVNMDGKSSHSLTGTSFFARGATLLAASYLRSSGWKVFVA